MGAYRFHQIGEWQRGSRARSEQLLDAFERRNSLHLAGRLPWGVAECPALGSSVQHSFFVETIDRRHYSCVRLPDLAVGKELPHGGAAPRPEFLQQALLERT